MSSLSFISASISFSRTLSLLFLHHFPHIPFYLSAALCLYLLPFFFCARLFKNLPFCNKSPPHLPFFCHRLSINSSFHLLSSPSLSSPPSDNLSPPPIVVAVNYVICAEDMSFLSTRFKAQHDYTKPFSAVYVSLTHRRTHTFILNSTNMC